MLGLSSNAVPGLASRRPDETAVRAHSGRWIFDVETSNFDEGGPLEGYGSSTPTTADPDDDVDRDDNGAPTVGGAVRSGVISLAAATEPSDLGRLNESIDFGMVELAAVGDRVWRDSDRDGVQDAGEPGVPGVTVQLLDAAGTVIATTTTDANGNYLFEGLYPGTYGIQFVVSTLPAGYVVTLVNAGSDDAADSDAGANGRIIGITLDAGERDLTHDLGIHLPVIGPPTGGGMLQLLPYAALLGLLGLALVEISKRRRRLTV